jgi:hypothetical protein
MCLVLRSIRKSPSHAVCLAQRSSRVRLNASTPDTPDQIKCHQFDRFEGWNLTMLQTPAKFAPDDRSRECLHRDEMSQLGE